MDKLKLLTTPLFLRPEVPKANNSNPHLKSVFCIVWQETFCLLQETSEIAQQHLEQTPSIPFVHRFTPLILR